jgi:hypothetical protein
MRKILIGALITLAVVIIYQSWNNQKKESAALEAHTALIQEEIKNVSKLVVTEGHYAEVLSYKDSQQLFGSLITADKKALVVVNAQVAISYDLAQLTYEMDTTAKTLEITHIPEPEVKIAPDFEYYDISADYFNPFEAKDYNAIKNRVMRSLQSKIDASDLRKNAQNRLLSELQKMYVLTHSLGWTLEYNGQPVMHSEGVNNTILPKD